MYGSGCSIVGGTEVAGSCPTGQTCCDLGGGDTDTDTDTDTDLEACPTDEPDYVCLDPADCTGPLMIIEDGYDCPASVQACCHLL